jgi:hypothetical protein
MKKLSLRLFLLWMPLMIAVATQAEQTPSQTKQDALRRSEYFRNLRNSHLQTSPSEMLDCSESSHLAASEFIHNLCIPEARNPLGQSLVGFVSENVGTMEHVMSQRLIPSVNEDIFKQVVSALPYVANPAEQKILDTVARTPDEKLAKLKTVCQKFKLDQNSITCRTPAYADALEAGLTHSRRNKDKHFLTQTSAHISESFAFHFEQIYRSCRRKNNYCQIGFANSEDCLQAQRDSKAAVKKEVNDIFNDPILGPYLVSESLISPVSKVGFSQCSPLNGIEQLTHADTFYPWVENAKEEFRDITLDQLKTCGNNGLRDLGLQNQSFLENRSDELGAIECNVSIQRKNEMTALSEQFTTYPQILAQTMNKMSQKNRELYSGVICNALKCGQRIDTTNKYIKNGAMVAVVVTGVVATGGAGLSVVALGASASEVAITGAGYLAEKSVLNQQKKELLTSSVFGQMDRKQLAIEISKKNHELSALQVETAVSLALSLSTGPASILIKQLAVTGKISRSALESSVLIEKVSADVMKSSVVLKLLEKIPEKGKEKAMELILGRVKESVAAVSKTMQRSQNGEKIDSDDYFRAIASAVAFNLKPEEQSKNE